MGQVHQDLNALGDDVMRRLILDIDHEADTAGVVLVLRVVETLGLRKPVKMSRVHGACDPDGRRHCALEGFQKNNTASKYYANEKYNP
jgi:hypothetical protein